MMSTGDRRAHASFRELRVMSPTAPCYLLPSRPASPLPMRLFAPHERPSTLREPLVRRGSFDECLI